MPTSPPRAAPESTAPPPTPAQADASYVHTLREAGLLSDLTDTLLQVFLERLGATDRADARRLDILELYYQGGGDEELGRRRVLKDRFLVHRDDEGVDAFAVVRRLVALLPELKSVQLERIGSEQTDDGPLVLRAGELLSAIDDPQETGETEPTVQVRSLVAAMNVLLERSGVRARLLLLRTDGTREAFLATGTAEAMTLFKSGCLESQDPEALLEFAAW